MLPGFKLANLSNLIQAVANAGCDDSDLVACLLVGCSSFAGQIMRVCAEIEKKFEESTPNDLATLSW